jgi:hypothetical protein
MNYNICTYVFYLLITLVVVLNVGHVLFKNGRVFLINTFNGNEVIADSVNKVLLAGYYLINAGYCITVLKVWETVISFQQMINVLSFKSGFIILTLGIMHLFNVLVLIRIGKNSKNKLYTNH